MTVASERLRNVGPVQLVDSVGNLLSSGTGVLGSVGAAPPMLPTAFFICPAGTPTYVIGQLVANSATAGSVVYPPFTISRVTGKGGMLRRVRLRKTGTSIVSASFRVHLYRSQPTFSNGDNAAWLTDQSANYVGSLDVTCDRVFTDGASGNGVPNIGSEINFTSDVYYWALEARAAYQRAASEQFTIEFEDLPN